MSFVEPKYSIVGIDVGSSAIKIAGIKKNGTQTELEYAAYRAFNTQALPLDELEKQAFLAGEIKFCLQAIPKKKFLGATSIAGSSVIVREAKLPALPSQELEKTLSFEAEPFIPFDVREVTLDYHVIGEVSEEGQNKYESILIAAKKDLIESRLAVLAGSGIAPAIVDVDAFAVSNLLKLVPSSAEETSVVVNIGNTITNMVILEKGTPRLVRDVAVAGNTFSKALQNNLNIDAGATEQAKKETGIILDEGEIQKIVQEGAQQKLEISKVLINVATDLLAEVHKSTDFYLTHGVDRTIHKIYLSGGGALLRNLAPFAKTQMNIPTEVLNPFDYISLPAKSSINIALGPMFSIACGLALRQWEDWIKA